MSTPKQETPATVEVTLLKDHTHGGKKLKKDAKIQVTAKQREFLIKRKIIASNSAAMPKATTSKAKS
ncbi:DUF7210 family protein [Marinobacterium litorale]|jgi:hypothetical protein|uniref:DUF7210 family protein n=1 Tax=Marinobacterium litorale TaxID=404770 RepID=UPI00041CADA0|nr:hypothetical protein [Marinobacterium litorale]